MTHVVFLNGPPRSGKDTIGRIITDAVPGARAVKYAHALKVATHALFAGLRGAEGARHAATERGANTDDVFEHVKGEALAYFYGKTPREAYIAVSELLCKPLFGQQFFGRLLADEIVRHPDVPVWAITDSGFADEALPIIEAVGRGNCTLARVYREGCTFAGDSRSYIDLDVPAKFDVHNYGEVNDLPAIVLPAILGLRKL